MTLYYLLGDTLLTYTLPTRGLHDIVCITYWKDHITRLCINYLQDYTTWLCGITTKQPFYSIPILFWFQEVTFCVFVWKQIFFQYIYIYMYVYYMYTYTRGRPTVFQNMYSSLSKMKWMSPHVPSIGELASSPHGLPLICEYIRKCYYWLLIHET